MTDNRKVLALTGADRISFLQGLVTNNVSADATGLTYAALLTPQGKFIADFFVVPGDDRLLIDVAESHAAALAQRLTMYRLRADVQIADTEIAVARGTGDAPEGAFADPRHAALGWRAYGADSGSDGTDWNALYVAHMIPQTGAELTPDTFILEAGFERLNGIDFKKGCYVGQEIAARMKHKTELRKGLALVAVSGSAAPGDAIEADGKPVGVVHRVAGDRALAYLRYDRAERMQTDNAQLTLIAKATP